MCSEGSRKDPSVQKIRANIKDFFKVLSHAYDSFGFRTQSEAQSGKKKSFNISSFTALDSN
jgi:hypothetical protein